ncbi:hypothetical protein HZB00_03100, partial [Candidatus Woesearchaeota archaeon]|nr:hypothetical protein [Candidatus Woesearchaeota archaeon]
MKATKFFLIVLIFLSILIGVFALPPRSVTPFDQDPSLESHQLVPKFLPTLAQNTSSDYGQTSFPLDSGDCPDASNIVKGPPRILCFKLIGDPSARRQFQLHAVGKDPDDNLTLLVLKKISSSSSPIIIPCQETVCPGTWNITEEQEGAVLYVVEAWNKDNQRGSATLNVLVRSSGSPQFILRTAAVERDGIHPIANQSQRFVNPTTISVTNGNTTASQTGNPFATFHVPANILLQVSYTAEKFSPDNDFYFFDERLNTCQENQCQFTNGERTTTCTMFLTTSSTDLSAITTYSCRYQHAAYAADFLYTPFGDPLGKNVIHVLNPLYSIKETPLGAHPYTAPALSFSPTVVRFQEDEVVTGFDLDQFVHVQGFDKKDLAWHFIPSSHININISDQHKASFSLRDQLFLGKEFVSFRVVAPTGESAEDKLLVDVVPKNNLAPQFVGFTPYKKEITMEFGNTTNFTALAFDREYDPLAYQWKINDAVILKNSLWFSYKPKQVGKETIAVEASDGKQTSSFDWNVFTQDTIPPTQTNFTITPHPLNRTQPVSIS